MVARNKPKVPLIGIREMSADTMESRVLEVPSGYNVIYALEAFIHSCQLEVIVMSARGMVHNVTLRPPFVVQGTVDNTRLFEIVSLTGPFPRGSDTLGRTVFRVNLVDAQGNIVGGTVESMIAHGSVLVILGTAMAINREVLNVRPKLHEVLLSPGARAAQQQFRAPTLMNIQSAPPMASQQRMDIQSVLPMALQQQGDIQLGPPVPLEEQMGILDSSMPLEEQLDIQPDPVMTMQQQIEMMSMNNLVPNLAIGSGRPNPLDGSLQAGVRPNLGDVFLHGGPNLARDSVGSNSYDVFL